ncbi:uncharacterized protein LOC118443424 isoform X2 [Vespa mandarinia]|uniref:uncharacterized protein LOC118443424 isoform X2 n=1 Tax=Vespa mandarinia TaxID=7446 RepID=UPI0016115A63|nr:uncharacterized protein LOC118443424 isoform X2 [Vespa mandarinia]
MSGNCDSLSTPIMYKSQFIGIDDEPCNSKCLFCENSFILPTNEKDFLTHLFKEHRLVIGDVWKIASLKRFKEQPITDFCTTLLMDCTSDGKPSKNESYFLLSDCISEDKTLRDEIYRVKLEWVLAKQSEERSDTSFTRGCMFCKMNFSVSRIIYIKHLSEKHNLYLGKPENLVFIDELLDKIQHSIESLICIYCEKVFKDRTALKEHMRKKLHKKINPYNKTFDKFYINNYSDPSRTRKYQKHYKYTKDTGLSSESEDEELSWSDWNDESISIFCLFCNHSDKDFPTILQHIKEQHNFDFKEVSKDLTFYQKVKLVNYIRGRIRIQCCILCEEKSDNILEHMNEKDHYKIPKQYIWDQPEFYFPMNENDSFLYNLDTDNDSSEENDIEINNSDKGRLTGKDCLDYSDDNYLIKIRVEGLITTIAFHKARLYAQKLYQYLPQKYAVPQIREMFQVDWYEYLQKMKVRVGGKMWVLKRHVAVFINDAFIGSDIEFFNYLNELYVFHMPKNIGYYETHIGEYYKKFIKKTKRVYVYFTFTLDGFLIGSLLFMLYSDLLPKTCKHFLNFCTGKYENIKGFKVSHYINTYVHRIVKNGWIQFGDIKLNSTNFNTPIMPTIADESYCIPHNRRGILSMANNGKHSNESQIIVSLKPNTWMNHYYVAFGQLVDGIQTLQKIEDIPTYYESPLKKVIVSQCGEYTLDHKPKMEAETDIFLERQPWIDVGENNMVHQYPYNTYSDISVWLNNITDEIDIRDTPSLLIAERYLSSLYCLSMDYLSEMNTSHLDKDQELYENIDLNYKPKLCELLTGFRPETMSKIEKEIFIKKLCKIIISYALNSVHNKCCILKDTYGTLHSILECAYDIARVTIAKLIKQDINIMDTRAEINKLFKIQHQDDKKITDSSLSLIEKILNKSILHSLQSTNIVDCDCI